MKGKMYSSSSMNIHKTQPKFLSGHSKQGNISFQTNQTVTTWLILSLSVPESLHFQASKYTDFVIVCGGHGRHGLPWCGQVISGDGQYLAALRTWSSSKRGEAPYLLGVMHPGEAPVTQALSCCHIKPAPTNSPGSRSRVRSVLHPHPRFFFPKQTMWYCD